MWAQSISAALDFWLIAAPAVLGYGGAARTNDRIVGPLIASVALIAVWEVTRPVRWANIPLGLWLILAPWLVGFHGVARPASVVVGALVIACALIHPRGVPAPAVRRRLGEPVGNVGGGTGERRMSATARRGDTAATPGRATWRATW